MKIGVTGATGHLGRIVVSKLKEKIPSDNIVALVRSPEKASELGVKSRKADYDQPDTLAPALEGIDTLLLISASEIGKRAVQHRNIIDAASRAGVKWIVYTSLLHADHTSFDLAEEHLATEAALKDSGIPFTILRNGWYSENYTASISGALQGGAYIGSAGDGKLSLASRKDYAEAAVAILVAEDQQGKVYELAGDTAYTLKDLAAEISHQTGKDIPYKNLSQSEYAQILASFGVPEGFSKVIAGWDVSASKGDLFDEGHQLSKLIGRPTTPLSESVAEALQGN